MLSKFGSLRLEFEPQGCNLGLHAVILTFKLVHVRCEGEMGSGPKGADDLCWAEI